MSACDKVKALINIDAVCNISGSLASLNGALPAQSAALGDAAARAREALQTGPRALNSLNNGIAGGSVGVSSMILSYRRLALSPVTVANQAITEYTRDVRIVTREVIKSLDTLQCVSKTLTNKTVPGIGTVQNCLAKGVDKLTNVAQKTRDLLTDFGNSVNDAIDQKLDSWQDDLNGVLQDLQDDNGAVACMASAVKIPNNTLNLFGTRLADVKISQGDFKKHLGGCTGSLLNQARDLADAAKALDNSLDKITQLNQSVDDLYTRGQNLAQNVAPSDRKPFDDAISPLAGPPFNETTVQEIEAARQFAREAQASLEAAAERAQSAISAYTFGHEIYLDRVNDIIRIRHRDKYTMLFTASNIISATEVVYKRLAWLENMMQKYNNHTHFYRPGSGPVIETTRPLLQIDDGDGTTITLAG